MQIAHNFTTQIHLLHGKTKQILNPPGQGCLQESELTKPPAAFSDDTLRYFGGVGLQTEATSWLVGLSRCLIVCFLFFFISTRCPNGGCLFWAPVVTPSSKRGDQEATEVHWGPFLEDPL